MKTNQKDQNTLTASRNISTLNDVNMLAAESAPNVSHSHKSHMYQ